MARSIWSGAVSFGLVNVPVGMYTAVEEHEIGFHQFERDTTSRIRYKRVNEDTGDEVEYDDIVKGAEVGDGEYVMLTQEELESVEPGKSRTIEISDFVDASDIDPIYYQKSYYLAPKDDAAAKPYALLAKAMQKAGRIGIATFVMRNKEYLAAIRPAGKQLILETMYFADEVRDAAAEIESLPVETSTREKDVKLAVDLIEAMTTDWNPKNYRDTYAERVEELVRAKQNDEEIQTYEEPGDEGEVVDLMEALQRSLEGSKRDRSDDTPKLDSLSKSALYELAQQADLPGRSQMTRKELVDALRSQSSSGRKAS